MAARENLLFKIGWVLLTINGLALLIFGLIVSAWSGGCDPLYLRAIGIASIGIGLFGVMITIIAYRRRERWAWFTLWYYPVFWTAHFLGGLPPGQEHIHQIAFIVMALAGLIISAGEFFPRLLRRQAG